MRNIEGFSRIVIVFLVLAVFDGALWVALGKAIRRDAHASLYFLDVGQGDSSLIVLPGSVQILVDGGPPNRKVIGELQDALGVADRYIDLLVMTHPQLDHYGGFLDVVRHFEIGAFVATGRAGETDAHRALRDAIATKKIPYLTLRGGDEIRVGASRLKFLSPTEDELFGKELNDTSLVFRLETQGITALYTGDIGPSVEARLIKENITSFILKTPHHGSRFSSTAKFLGVVQPRIATIGVGKNSYGHPTSATLKRLEAVGATVFRTDENRTVRIFKDKETLKVSVERGE